VYIPHFSHGPVGGKKRMGRVGKKRREKVETKARRGNQRRKGGESSGTKPGRAAACLPTPKKFRRRKAK